MDFTLKRSEAPQDFSQDLIFLLNTGFSPSRFAGGGGGRPEIYRSALGLNNTIPGSLIMYLPHTRPKDNCLAIIWLQNHILRHVLEIYTRIYEEVKIGICMNLKDHRVALKTQTDTPDVSKLQNCTYFAHNFMLGFDVINSMALLRMDELYMVSFR
ncbi:RNA-binding KH domain-containing protein [Striga hermonthica]|uniref:RNA-binding KH domain-containing protein n=1 Tax=Striga hermonthica TaxID=68872 RepID=A0A9N7N641_STRHE|nr:RNA-binding KH domain-containing protein [Striga hermonthica]